jgi:hypothetical protein
MPGFGSFWPVADEDTKRRFAEFLKERQMELEPVVVVDDEGKPSVAMGIVVPPKDGHAATRPTASRITRRTRKHSHDR